MSHLKNHFLNELKYDGGAHAIYQTDVFRLFERIEGHGHSGSTIAMLMDQFDTQLERLERMSPSDLASLKVFTEFEDLKDPLDYACPTDMELDDYLLTLYRVLVACVQHRPLSPIQDTEDQWGEWLDDEDPWRMHKRSYEIVQRKDGTCYHTNGRTFLEFTDDFSDFIGLHGRGSWVAITMPLDRLPEPIYELRALEPNQPPLAVVTRQQYRDGALQPLLDQYRTAYLRGETIDGKLLTPYPTYAQAERAARYFHNYVWQILHQYKGDALQLFHEHPIYLTGSTLHPMDGVDTTIVGRMAITHTDPLLDYHNRIRPILKPDAKFQYWIPAGEVELSDTTHHLPVTSGRVPYTSYEIDHLCEPIYLDHDGVILTFDDANDTARAARHWLYQQCKTTGMVFSPGKHGPCYQINGIRYSVLLAGDIERYEHFPVMIESSSVAPVCVNPAKYGRKVHKLEEIAIDPDRTNS